MLAFSLLATRVLVATTGRRPTLVKVWAVFDRTNLSATRWSLRNESKSASLRANALVRTLDGGRKIA